MTPSPKGTPDPAVRAPNLAPRSPLSRGGRGAWAFDLDNTLYPARCKLFAQVEVRIRDYVAGFLGLDSAAAYRLQKVYFREHGTTLQGMMRHHGMEPGPFLAYVHDIDLSAVPPDPVLDQALGRLEGRKIIFTNGSAEHARKVMERIGVARHFEAVFDIAAAGYVPKPEPRVYDAFVRRHGLDPTATVMVEDIARNLVPAAAIGMTTVWVRESETQPESGLDPPDRAALAAIDHVVDDLALWLSDLTREEAT
ncbi:MAG: pyrimidine 5'-nucleotidase [Rhodospirillales bacterium]|nr:pyrimidine 5'-nucleotidase [Rhodospirillales bacterium]